MAYPIIKDLKALTNEKLIDYFDVCVVRGTKAANGFQNLSEAKWEKERERAKIELLRRMAHNET